MNISDMLCYQKTKFLGFMQRMIKRRYSRYTVVFVLITAFSLTTANAQDNSVTINQIGEKFTFIGFQIGSQNTLNGRLTDSRLNQAVRGAALYSAQTGSGNTINFNVVTTGSSSNAEALFALEQIGDNHINSINFSAGNVEISTLQEGDGTNFVITGNAESLLLKSSQSGSGHAATIKFDTGSYDVDFEQKGLGKKVAQIDLENTGGGIVTVDWKQTGSATDTNNLNFSCGSALGCDLSYQD